MILKELKLQLVELNDLISDIENELSTLKAIGIKDSESFTRAVELRNQLLRAYEIKTQMLKILYHV